MNWTLIFLGIIGIVIAITLNAIFVYIPVRRIETIVVAAANDVTAVANKTAELETKADAIAQQLIETDAKVNQLVDTVEKIADDIEKILDAILNLIGS
jgi:methyl-accepting chemotaxis protein